MLLCIAESFPVSAVVSLYHLGIEIYNSSKGQNIMLGDRGSVKHGRSDYSRRVAESPFCYGF